jgi:uncharacterized protein (TIGR02391 family)
MTPPVEELQRRARVLDNLHYDEASARLTGLLKWMQSEDAIRTVIDNLDSEVSGNEILNKADSHHPPQAATDEEIAAVGLALIRLSAMAPLYQILHFRGIKPRGSTNFQDTTNAAIARYIRPFINFVLNKLPRPAPDHSYVKHLTPLADVENLDSELASRCLPILGAGPADPKLWDSAVRTAGVILEERLRLVGEITDASVGRELVNKVFGKNGTLAKQFSEESEREGYRDLFAGVVGAFRNPSAHRLVDPTPHEGGAYIVFVNLLLTHLGRFATRP